MRDDRPSRILLCALIVWSAVTALAGCAPITTGTSPLGPVHIAPQSVGLEVTTARFPLEGPDVTEAIWNGIDEQHFSSELRRQLAANGFRVGVTGARLPPELERLLALNAEPPPAENNGTQVVDFVEEPSNVKKRLIRVGVGRRTHVICTGEAKRHDTLAVLIRNPDGKVTGRTYHKVMGILALKAFPQDDGHVKLEMSPEVEHGDPQRRYDPSEGILRVEFGPPREQFDLLRMTADLAAGQFLVVGMQANRDGSLGQKFFTEQTSERMEQKLVLIRVVDRPPETLFDSLPGGS